jgi:hypothetical protein
MSSSEKDVKGHEGVKSYGDDNVAVTIGMFTISYGEYNTVHIDSPSMSLKLSYAECPDIEIKKKCNAKLNGKDIIITEPEDGSKMVVSYKDDGEVKKIVVSHPNFYYYVASVNWFRMSWCDHNLYYKKYLFFPISMNSMFKEKKIKNTLAKKYGLQQEC